MCSNPNRDKSIICVVEDPRDVAAMEKIKELFAIRPSESVHMLHKAVISGRGSIEKPHVLPLVGWMNSKAVQQSACSVSPDGQPSFLPYNVSPASG